MANQRAFRKTGLFAYALAAFAFSLERAAIL